MKRWMAVHFVVSVILVVWIGGSGTLAESQPQPRADGKPDPLGTVHFATSCKAEVQPSFDRAVALLHSFWYGAAVKAFAEVGSNDPGCAMAHWGVAMSLWYPLWEPPSAAALKQGGEAVQKAKAIGGKTDRERDYIGAIETFYRDADKLDHRTRALAYEAAMERVYTKYPEDREAVIFYALALDATQIPTDKTYANVLKAGQILEKAFAEQPDHPGVAHYIIHSYDYPPLSARALDAARRYAKIAPSAPHALHMPSHIFTRRGLWEESIQSNAGAAVAAKSDADAQGQLHAMDYMVYAHLQLAQDGKAWRVVEETVAFGKIERETAGLEDSDAPEDSLRLDELAEEQEAIEETIEARSFSDKDRARAGCIIQVGYKGQLEIQKGYMKPGCANPSARILRSTAIAAIRSATAKRRCSRPKKNPST